MNQFKELEKLNNPSFKLLIFLPLLSFIGSLLLAKSGFDFKVVYIFYLAVVVLQIIIFIQDRKFLKEKHAFCPAWEWFILFPIYVYKRQRNNFLDLSYFYICLILFVLNAVITAYLKNL